MHYEDIPEQINNEKLIAKLSLVRIMNLSREVIMSKI